MTTPGRPRANPQDKHGGFTVSLPKWARDVLTLNKPRAKDVLIKLAREMTNKASKAKGDR